MALFAVFTRIVRMEIIRFRCLSASSNTLYFWDEGFMSTGKMAAGPHIRMLLFISDVKVHLSHPHYLTLTCVLHLVAYHRQQRTCTHLVQLAARSWRAAVSLSDLRRLLSWVHPHCRQQEGQHAAPTLALCPVDMGSPCRSHRLSQQSVLPKRFRTLCFWEKLGTCHQIWVFSLAFCLTDIFWHLHYWIVGILHK